MRVMRWALRRVWPVSLLITGSSIFTEGDSVEQANRALALAFEKAWNQHDMHAFGAMLTRDADWVNVAAMHWSGREEIEREHAARHAGLVFKDSVWTTRNVKVAPLNASLALVHIDWVMAGDRDPDGTPRLPREGVLSWVTVKDGGVWRIRASHNTNKRRSGRHLTRG
jgi:uncharacterized protein (TIGR02246 family)